jgi:phosphatidylglycerophosphate synthase
VGTTPLSARRLLGLDRSGPPPPETLRGQPLRPWTIPNAIGYARGALLVVFVVLAYVSDSHGGVDAAPGAIYFVAGMGDYADGVAARLTGQYSRLGSLLDPVLDRLIVSAGAVVCWSYELLPRWALAILLGRELLMLVVGRLWVARGLELRINWPGRIGVVPTGLGLLFGLLGLRGLGEGFLYVGIALALAATVGYYRAGVAQLGARRAAG